MFPRNPPPAPHLHAANLPHSHLRHVPHSHSQGETDVSYTAYSPSPSSLSNHRYKWARIRDWRSQNPAPPPTVRHIGSIGSHRPSVGVGSANWSDSGTGLDEGQTDIGTIPTTVRVDRELKEDSTIGPNKRHRVDPIRAMGSHHSRRTQREDDGGPSELPYRQNSQRRDARPANDEIKPKARPVNLTQRYDPTGRRAGEDSLSRAAAANAARPPLVHSSSRSKPTPHLARPPPPHTATPINQISPAGSPIVTSPESKGGKDSPFAIREAYLNSALTLPLDMLAQTEKAAPPAVPELRPAKSQSSMSSGLTTGRLGSLLGRGESRGPSPNGGVKRVVSDIQAVRSASADKQMKANVEHGNATRAHRGEAIEELIDAKAQVQQANSSSSSKTARPLRAQERTSRPADQLGRSATAPTKIRPPLVQAQTTEPQGVSALGLDLGSPAIALTRPSERLPSTQPPPTITVPLRSEPAPHRQVTALRRPALTPLNSTDNLAKTLALGRRSRDPSMTDLRTRFEPATYPLPDSKSSASGGKSHTSGSAAGAAKGKVEGPVAGMTSIKAKDKRRAEAGDKRAKSKADPESRVSNDRPELAEATSVIPPIHPHVSMDVPSQVDRPVLVVGQAVPRPDPPMPITDIMPAAPLPRSDQLPPPLPQRVEPVLPDTDRSLASQTQESSPLSSPVRPVSASRRSPKVPRVNRIREDDDRVSFEVPNGARGRLRVSLAWFRDRGGRTTATHTDRASETPPPPVPPKPKRISYLRPPDPMPISSTDTADQISPPRRIPSPRPTYLDPGSQRHAPMHSPLNLDQPAAPRPYPTFDPYRPHATVPVYRPGPTAPPIPPFQINHPFAYPQPHAWASHPQLVPPHVQLAQPPAQGSRRPPSIESFDPPSAGGTPPAPHRMLPGMMSGPMGMQSNKLHPFSTQSLHPAGMQVQSPTRVGFAQPTVEYDRQHQPLWKRMFNGNGRQNDWQDGGYGMNGDDDEGVGVYGRRPRGFGNDKIGRWMRGITPGRAPPSPTLAARTVAGGSGGIFGARGNKGGRRQYNLSQPFSRRRNDRGDGYYVNGIEGTGTSSYGQRPNPYADHLDMLDNNPPRRSTFLPRQGGMLDRMFTPATRRRSPFDAGQGVWSTNQPRQTTAYDARDRYKEAKRREKIDRRNARAQAQAQGDFLTRTQPQGQGQRGGRSQTMVANWVGRFGNNRSNGYGVQQQGLGRKLSRRGGGKWKERIPKGDRRGLGGGGGRRYGAGGGASGGNALGMMGIGRSFRR